MKALLFRARWVLFAALFASLGVRAAEPLPVGLGGINAGDPWLLVKDRYPFRNVSSLASRWDRLARDCGSFNLVTEREGTTLYVTVHDYVVTALSETRPLAEGSDLLKLRRETIERFGSPTSELLKNVLGVPVTDPAQVNYIVMYYDVDDPVRINLSGRALWQIQTRIEYHKGRLHENKSNRCVRQRQARG